MSDNIYERVWDMLDEAEQMPEGEMKVHRVEQAVRLADQSRDVDLMFPIRLALTEAASLAGQYQKALPMFSWCVAKFDEEPDRFEEFSYYFLWNFKYVLHGICEFPQVSRVQIEGLLDQMAEHYQSAGYGMQPVHYMRLMTAMNLGDLATAAEAFPRWHAAPRNDLSDCEACELDNLVDYHAMIEGPEKALAAAEPILAGHMVCGEIPHRTLARVLQPLALLGKLDLADEYQTKGYRLIRTNPTYLDRIAEHIAYLRHRGRLRAAANMVERHLNWALETFELESRYRFYVAVEHLLAKLAEKKSARKLKLPATFPLYDPSGTYDLARLADWFGQENRELGERFNQRNGNDYLTTSAAEQYCY